MTQPRPSDRSHLLPERGVSMGTTLVQWQQFTEGRAPEGSLPPVILESWQRCRAAGVEPAPKQPQPRRIPDEELETRRRASARLLAVARAQLGLASACLAGVHHALILTDANGIVLEAAGNEAQAEALGLTPGHDWSEQRLGTNGAGTALAADRPVSVTGPDHFRKSLHDWACAGSPVHDTRGKVVGAVNLVT